MKFYEKLRVARMSAGMSRAALAEAVGLKKRTIAFYEMGVKTPAGYAVYKRLAEALGTDAQALINDSAELPARGSDESRNAAAARFIECMADFVSAEVVPA